MRIRVNKDTLMKLGVLIFLFLDCRFFYLIKLPERLGGPSSNKYMLAIGSLVICFFFLLVKRQIKFGKFGFYVMALYGVLFINIIAMKIRWHYRDTQIMWFIIPYFIILMYFVMADFFQKHENYLFFLKYAEYVCIGVGILMIAQVFYWGMAHTLFLDVHVMNYYLYRYDVTLRLYGYCDGLMRMVIFFAANEIINADFRWKGNKLHYFAFVISFISILYVDQSRVYHIIEIVALFAMYLEKRKGKLQIKRGHVLFLAIVALAAVYVFRDKALSLTMSMLNSNDGARYARIGAVSHYFENFTDWLFTGYGIVIPEETSMAYGVIKGVASIYNYDDIGIIGVFVSLGILGLIWYLVLLAKLWNVSKVRSSYQALNKGLFVAFTLAIFTQSYLDRGRLVSLMLTLAIMDAMSSGHYVEEGV